MIQQTSLEAFSAIKQDLGNKQRQVLKAIKTLSKPNNKDISNYLGLPINSVTPRVNELVKLDLIQKGGTKKDVYTKRKSIYWVIK